MFSEFVADLGTVLWWLFVTAAALGLVATALVLVLFRDGGSLEERLLDASVLGRALVCSRDLVALLLESPA